MTAVCQKTSARLVLEHIYTKIYFKKPVYQLAGPAPRIKQAKIFVSASPTNAAQKLEYALKMTCVRRGKFRLVKQRPESLIETCTDIKFRLVYARPQVKQEKNACNCKHSSASTVLKSLKGR